MHVTIFITFTIVKVVVQNNMNLIEIVPILFLIVILPIAAMYDIRFHKIPNWLTFPTMAAGIAFYTYMKGPKGLIFSVEGLLLGMAFFIVF